MRVKDHSTIAMDDGTEFYCNCGIIGLGPTFEITEGYDGGFHKEITPEYRKEIADYMISEWKKVLDGQEQVEEDY